MKAFDWEGMMMDDIMGELDPIQKSLLEAEMKKSPHLLGRYAELKIILEGVDDLPLIEAPESLSKSFDSFLAQEQGKVQFASTPKIRSFSWVQAVAAVGLLLIGIASIMWVNKGQQNDVLAMQQELLRETKVMMNNLLNESSTSSRIKGINVSYTIDKPDEELLNVLIEKLKNDRSTNVRLAAAEALIQFGDVRGVQQALTHALLEEENAIVQIALIHTLVNMKATNALKTMENLLEEESTSDDVKDELRLGMLKMT